MLCSDKLNKKGLLMIDKKCTLHAGNSTAAQYGRDGCDPRQQIRVNIMANIKGKTGSPYEQM